MTKNLQKIGSWGLLGPLAGLLEGSWVDLGPKSQTRPPRVRRWAFKGLPGTPKLEAKLDPKRTKLGPNGAQVGDFVDLAVGVLVVLAAEFTVVSGAVGDLVVLAAEPTGLFVVGVLVDFVVGVLVVLAAESTGLFVVGSFVDLVDGDFVVLAAESTGLLVVGVLVTFWLEGVLVVFGLTELKIVVGSAGDLVVF